MHPDLPDLLADHGGEELEAEPGDDTLSCGVEGEGAHEGQHRARPKDGHLESERLGSSRQCRFVSMLGKHWDQMVLRWGNQFA